MIAIEFNGSHFEREVILWGVRWYVAYLLRYGQTELMMQERGVEVDHSTLQRWMMKYVPLLEGAFLARKRRCSLQELLVSGDHPRQYRDHAHDPQGPAVLNRKAASGAAILLPRG